MIEIHNQDCLIGMKKLEDNKFDMIFTDPPFNTAFDKETEKRMVWRNSKINKLITADWDKFTDEEFLEFNKKWLTECFRLLRPKGTLAVFNFWKNIPEFILMAEEIGFKREDLVTWFKPNAPLGFPNTLIRSCEYVLMFNKPSQNSSYKRFIKRGYLMRNCIVKPITSTKERKKGNHHPTQKPISIIEMFLKKYTEEGNWILDPFLGSATTAVACQRMNRNCVGFEKDKGYYETSLKRIEIEKSQKGLKEWLS